MKHNFLPTAFLQNKFVSFEEANISIATHALHYGTAAFGGMRINTNPDKPDTALLFRPDRHAKRLSASAKLLNWELSEKYILDKIIEFVKTNKPTKPSYIRPLVYTSDLGISPRLHDIEYDFLIYGIELGDYLSPEGVSCRFSSWYRQEDRSLPLRGKISGAYITSSLAKTEAVASGFDESIMLNTRGKVCEGSGMNIFIVREDKIITPGVNQDILEGITRDSVITIAKEMGYEVEEREVDKTELLIADEVFLTGTAAKVTPVKQIENTLLNGPKPVTQKLLEKITSITLGQDQTYSDWITEIKW